MYAPVTNVPRGQAKPKCEAVNVVLLYKINRERDAIMTRRDQTDISLLGIFL